MLFDVYLTNKRLILPSIIDRVLEYNPNFRMESDIEIPLEKVRMVSVEKYPETNFSLLKIELERKRRKETLFDRNIEEFVLLNAERWKEEIINLRARKILQRERGIVIDFFFIREYLDKGVLFFRQSSAQTVELQ